MLLLIGLCLTCNDAQDPALPAKDPASIRQVINFNRDFLFRLGVKKDGERLSLDDSAWEPIGLPHSFSLNNHNLVIGQGLAQGSVGGALCAASRNKLLHSSECGEGRVSKVFVFQNSLAG